MTDNQEYEQKTLAEAKLINELEGTAAYGLIEKKVKDRVDATIKDLCELDSNKKDAVYLAGELKGLLTAEKYRNRIKARGEEIAKQNILEEE